MIYIELNNTKISKGWENFSFKEHSRIEEKIKSNKNINISFDYYEFLSKEIKDIKNIKKIFINSYGQLNFFKEDENNMIYYPFKVEDAEFLFDKKKKAKDSIFKIYGASSIQSLQEILAKWDGEDKVIHDIIEKNILEYLIKWSKYFNVKLIKEKKKFLSNFNIDGCGEFAKIKFGTPQWRKFKKYKNPEYSNELDEISQKDIINSIIGNSLNAINDKEYSDHFITAPTGSGKSLIFQSAAYYLSKKHKLLTVIVSPLLSLINDQLSNFKKKLLQSINYKFSTILYKKNGNDWTNQKWRNRYCLCCSRNSFELQL